MWVDSSTFFAEDLTWINNIKNENFQMLNKLSSDPDLLTYRLGYYDKPDGYY